MHAAHAMHAYMYTIIVRHDILYVYLLSQTESISHAYDELRQALNSSTNSLYVR